MIDWLNSNEGFVLGILTFVYVIATIVLVATGLRQTYLTRLALKRSDESEQRRYRPYVIFDMYSENIAVYASLKNIGASPALNIHLQVEPELRQEIRGEECPCPLLGNSISFLAPNREVRDACGFGEVFNQQFPEQIFRGTVSYSDSNGNHYNEKFHLDLKAQRSTSYVAKKEPARELEKIAKTLESMTSPGFKPLIRVITENDYRKEQDELMAEITKRCQKQKNSRTRKTTSSQTPSTVKTVADTPPDQNDV